MNSSVHTHTGCSNVYIIHIIVFVYQVVMGSHTNHYTPIHTYTHYVKLNTVCSQMAVADSVAGQSSVCSIYTV